MLNIIKCHICCQGILEILFDFSVMEKLISPLLETHALQILQSLGN